MATAISQPTTSTPSSAIVANRARISTRRARYLSARRARYGAVGVTLAPAVMLVALVAHPFIEVLPDEVAVGKAVADGTTYWGVVHLLTVIGSALVALAFLAIRAYLRDAGEERFSAWALPFVMLGSAVYGLLPGLEFAPMGVALSGGDVEGVQSALRSWFIGILVSSVALFAVGIAGFAFGVAKSRVLGRGLSAVVVTALVVLALSRAVPLGAVQFYVQAGAGLVALWPLAHRMWTAPAGSLRSIGEARTDGPQRLAG